MRTTLQHAMISSALALVAACAPAPGTSLPPPASPSNHRWFPIAAGSGHAFGKTTVDGVIKCESCHAPEDFTQYQCTSCHKHSAEVSPRLHLGVSDFAANTGCYQCHASGEKVPFTHAGITANATGQCAQCHEEAAAFAALPKPGFTHRAISGDCGQCHQNVASWVDAAGAAADAFDPTRSVAVDALQPAWAGTSIVSVAPDPQLIPMTMNHAASSVDAGVLSVCSNCHAQADQGQYYPGVMHWSLSNLGVAQPTTCVECHGSSSPKGFVGALDSRRAPASGEMKHDAVAWANDAPITTRLVTMGCETCHQPPADLLEAKWTLGRADGGVPAFHRSLTAANVPQPAACLDCHANSRPTALVVTAARTFDHSTARGECSTCHTSTAQWAGGMFHTATAPPPTTCLPCHAGDRPTSTGGWLGNFLSSPFDFITNANGVTHGSGQDCAVCHAGPGTGLWGTNQNWRSGRFAHGPGTVAASTCIDCHTTQRPDRLTPPAQVGFDHAASGTGDCLACHQATAMRGSYVNLLPIPGGDWRDGQTYPGSSLISTPGQSVRLSSTALNKTGALVTSMTTSTVNLPNAFLHTSSAIPAAISPGSAANPNQQSCWHCHTATGTSVTALSNGVFHSALSSFRLTPTAAVTPLAQPTTCNDCHRTMRPPNVVSKADGGTWLAPMDHSATFSGGSVASVSAMDCGSCHRTPGLGSTQWSDGRFHSSLPAGASPSECVSCHYPLITTSQADVIDPKFTMKHRSSLITTQACASCHGTALSRSTQTPSTAALWKTGAYHSTLTAATQPATCLECHASSDPPGATPSTVAYALPQGATATNVRQWMNHANATVSGKDCVVCHRADARVAVIPWSTSTAFHSNVPTGVTHCASCHGLTNGNGTGVGTNNNLPVGLIDTASITSSSAATPNTFDQLVHTDLNVTRVDCNFCHSQVGPSTAAALQGKEWTKAVFHRSFTTASPMVVNGTTARCSNCHLNVKPGPAYAAFNHSAFTPPSTQDCASCHSWPGSNASSPNWLGATGAHAATGPTATSLLDCNTCHGQNGSANTHLAVSAATHFGGINNGNKCTSCHVNFAGFKGSVTNLKYAHTNATANGGTGCATCHAFAGQLYTTLTLTPPLTRPTATGGHQFSQTTSVTGAKSNKTFTSNHTNTGLTRCGACHQYVATTASTDVWSFKHDPGNPGISNSKSTSGCNMCH